MFSYSISPFGFLGDAHQFAISYRFGPSVIPLPGPIEKEPARQIPPRPVASETSSLQVPVSTSSIAVPVVPGNAASTPTQNSAPQPEKPAMVLPPKAPSVSTPRPVKPMEKTHLKKSKAPTAKEKVPEVTAQTLIDKGLDNLKEGRF